MPDSVGVVEVLYGSASASDAGNVRFLEPGSVVHEGEMITTGEDSALEIRFRDGTILSQAENSEVDLDTYVFDPETDAGDVLLKLTQGTFRAATGRIVDANPEKFKIQSPLATIGIRGTHTGHFIPGDGRPENHGCLEFDGKPVVVQSNVGGPPQTLFGSGLSVAASAAGLGSIGSYSAGQLNFFEALSPENMAREAPPLVPPPDLSEGDDAGQDDVVLVEVDSGGAGDDGPAEDVGGEGGGGEGAQLAPDMPGAYAGPGAGMVGETVNAATVAATVAATDVAAGNPAPFGPEEGDPDPEDGDSGDSDIIEGEARRAAEFVPEEAAAVVISPSVDDPPPDDPPPDDPPEEKKVEHHYDQGDFTTAETAAVVSLDPTNLPSELGAHVPYYRVTDSVPNTEMPSSVNDLDGSSFCDKLEGNNNANSISGNAGDDSIWGLDGTDTLSGGDGADKIWGGDGSDLIDGGAGSDTSLDGGAGNDLFVGSTGSDSIFGQADDDFLSYSFSRGGGPYSSLTITHTDDNEGSAADNGGSGDTDTFTGIEKIVGSGGDDTYTGSDYADFFDGAGGGDTADGGAGVDTLIGNAGNDTLAGEQNVDTIWGGAGKDTFTLGGLGVGGSDKIYYNEIETSGNADIIHQFFASGYGAESDFLIMDTDVFGLGLASGGCDTGVLDSSRFQAAAHHNPGSADIRFMVDTSGANPTLWWDPDGNATSGDEVQLAEFTGLTGTLSCADIYMENWTIS